MTTNQTIDGVPRELIEILIGDAGSLSKRHASHILRALLDAEPVMCHGCMTESVSPDHFDSAGKCKAAQPQGEPVAWMDPICLERMGRQPERNFVVTGQCKSTYSVPLYAEQPAPVAVVLPERQEVDKYGEFYDSGWNDCLDELKRLNPSL